MALLKCKARSSIREVAKLIGLFTSSLHAINLEAVHFRCLDKDKVHACQISHNEYDNEIVLNWRFYKRNTIVDWQYKK